MKKKIIGLVKTTIIESNLSNGRLTTKQSTENIFDYIKMNYESGTFWNSENCSNLQWQSNLITKAKQHNPCPAKLYNVA